MLKKARRIGVPADVFNLHRRMQHWQVFSFDGRYSTHSKIWCALMGMEYIPVGEEVGV